MLGLEVAVVLGGGNIFRGAYAKLPGLDRVTADAIGMLATVQNALLAGDVLAANGVKISLFSSFEIPGLIRKFSAMDARKDLAAGRVVILGGGTGNPFFSTDTASILRGLEINADVFFKATKVDGIYDQDPKKFPDARRYETLSYKDAVSNRLAVMDLTAFSMCMEHEMPIVVFNYFEQGSLLRHARGQRSGTLVSADPSRMG